MSKKPAGPAASKWYVADADVAGDGYRIAFGEARLGSDPIVAQTFGMWVKSPVTADELKSHAGARTQAAFDEAMAAKAQREADELEHGPLEMTAAEKGRTK